MKNEKIAILPQLNDCKGDLTKKWFVFFSYKDPQSGTMKRFKIYKRLHKCKIKEERYKVAYEIIEDYRQKIKNGWNPFVQDNVIYTNDLQYKFAARIYGKIKEGNQSFNYFASKYLSEIANGLDPDTISTYKSKLRIFNQWLDSEGLMNVDITSVTNEIVINFFKFLISRRKLAEISTKKYKQILHQVFDFIIDDGDLLINPVQRIPINTRVNDQTPRPIQDFDIDLFKEELKNDKQLWLVVLFQYYCFLRPGKEIRFLKIKWIDFARGRITVPKSISKTRRDKIIIVPNEFLLILRNDYNLNNYPREFFVIGKNGVPGKDHLGKNNIRYRFVKIRKKLGMPEEYKLYSWKHTGNVRAEGAKIPLIDRQHQNGHSSARTTEIYTKNKIGYDSIEIRENFPSI